MATWHVATARPVLSKSSAGVLALRVVAVAALAVSGYVHLHRAGLYTAVGGTITEGALFYAQGVLAVLVALWLLVRGSRPAWLAAALLGTASVGAVLLYRYVDVGAIGPLPNMYEPIWYAEKTVSAVAEALLPVLWLAQLGLRRRSATPAQPVAPSSPS